MENEVVSRNFIEQIIDNDIEDGHCKKSLQDFPRTKWLSSYRTC